MKKGTLEISIILTIFTLLTFFSPVIAKGIEVNQEEISRQQLEAQISLFKNALDKFGATDLMQVVDLYTLGHKERNGVYQYAVLCDNLKQEFIKQRDDPSKTFWIIGGSSPWLADYKLLENKKVDDKTQIIKLQLHWQASGYNDYEEKTLTISKQGNKWFITSISPMPQF